MLVWWPTVDKAVHELWMLWEYWWILFLKQMVVVILCACRWVEKYLFFVFFAHHFLPWLGLGNFFSGFAIFFGAGCGFFLHGGGSRHKLEFTINRKVIRADVGQYADVVYHKVVAVENMVERPA